MNPSTSSASQTRQRRTRLIVTSWAAVVIVAGAIFWMSSNSGDSINSGLGIISAVKAALVALVSPIAGPGVDVSPIGHFGEYLLFGAVLFNALRLHVSPRQALVLALVLGSGYGITDELHQLLVPDRSCDPIDWVVDTVATGLGALIARGIVGRRGRS